MKQRKIPPRGIFLCSFFFTKRIFFIFLQLSPNMQAMPKKPNKFSTESLKKNANKIWYFRKFVYTHTLATATPLIIACASIYGSFLKYNTEPNFCRSENRRCTSTAEAHVRSCSAGGKTGAEYKCSIGAKRVFESPLPPFAKAQSDVGAKPSVESPLPPFTKGERARRRREAVQRNRPELRVWQAFPL